MLTLAEHILDSKAGEFDRPTFRDRYEEALLAHLKAKQSGALMEALRRSVAEDKKVGALRREVAPTLKRAGSWRRAAMSRPSRVTDARPHERTR